MDGVQNLPWIITIHGPGGKGKSSLANLLMPNNIFLDVEGSTVRMDVKRLQKPTTSAMLDSVLNNFMRDPGDRKSLTIDTVDWVEPLFIQEVCGLMDRAALGGKDDFGETYGRLDARFRRFLDLLSEIRNRGINICVLAHSQVKKREVPEEFGAFDRYQLKLEKKTAAALYEWSEHVWFLNSKVDIVMDSKTKTKHGEGGRRIIYTVDHPCWDAKSRPTSFDLPDEIPFEKGKCPDVLKQFFSSVPSAPLTAAPSPPQQPPVASPLPAAAPRATIEVPAGFGTNHRKLFELAYHDGIQPQEIVDACHKFGFIPGDTPFEKLPEDVVAGALLGQWDKAKAAILKNRETANV